MKYCPACEKEFAEGDRCPNDSAVLLTKQSSTDPLLGRTLKDSYRIDERIATGGMGAVYRGLQLPIGRTVAIKVLLPELTRDADLVKRFFREAKLLAEVTHPHIVHLIDCGNTDDGIVFIVMEYLVGKTLEKIVPKNEGLPMPRVLRIMRQVASAVGEAHRKRLVHRDLKPSNVFVLERDDDRDDVRVLDFGIAKPLGQLDEKLTQAGMIVGTPGYIAPEQISGNTEADQRSDIYALGAVLYYLVAGRPPYSGGSAQSIIAKQLNEPPAPIPFEQIHKPPRLEKIILRAMEVEPSRRFGNTEELLRALRDIEDSTWDVVDGPTQSASTRDMKMMKVRENTRARQETTEGVRTTSFMRRRSLQRSLFVAALILTGTSAFVGSRLLNDDPRVTKVTPLEVTPGVDDLSIAIGMSAPFSGPARDLGRDMQVGIETAFKAKNAAGGVHGRRLELIALDDGYEPERARANMATFLDGRPVLAVAGSVGTPTAAAALPVALEAKVPFIGAFTGSEILREDPPARYVVNYRASYAEETAALVRYFIEGKRLKPDELAVFAQADAYGDSGFRGVVQALRAHGVTEGSQVLRVGYQRNSGDISEAVSTLAARSGKLRAIIMIATYGPATALIKQLRDKKLAVTFASVSFVGARSLADELRSLGPLYAEGVIVSQVVPHFDSKATGVLRYREQLSRHFASEEPSFVSLEGFVVGSLLVHALEKLGPDVTREGLIDALEATQGLDLGIGPTLSFGPSRHQGSDKVWAAVLDKNGRYQSLEL